MRARRLIPILCIALCIGCGDKDDTGVPPEGDTDTDTDTDADGDTDADADADTDADADVVESCLEVDRVTRPESPLASEDLGGELSRMSVRCSQGSWTVSVEVGVTSDVEAAETASMQVWNLSTGELAGSQDLQTEDGGATWSLEVDSETIGVECNDKTVLFTATAQAGGTDFEPDAAVKSGACTSGGWSSGGGSFELEAEMKSVDQALVWLVYPNQQALFGPFEMSTEDDLNWVYAASYEELDLANDDGLVYAPVACAEGVVAGACGY